MGDASTYRRRTPALAPLTLLFLISGPGCRKTPADVPTSQPPRWFEDVTAKSGLDFTHDCGPTGRFFMPQIIGSGCALFDFDNDGRLDILLIQNGGPQGAKNQLFHQEPDGTFKDVSEGSGLDVAGYGMGVAVGDVNNDGLPDVLITEYGGIRLFLNLGQGKFRDITREAGIENPQWATSAAFVDYDRDGHLDLVVVNYVFYSEQQACTDSGGSPDYCGPSIFPGTVSRLFHNVSKRAEPGVVRFEDVTAQSGLGDVPGPGLGVLCADFDGDGWPDIFIADDGKPNRLWMNQHDGTFKDEAAQRGVAYNGMGVTAGNMGIAFGDLTREGLFSLYVTHLTEEQNTLWMQNPRGTFQDRTADFGLASPAWRATGFGVVAADFQNNGRLDLAVVNGRVKRPLSSHQPQSGTFWDAYGERNQLFVNETGRFADISNANPEFCATPNIGRGLACGDIFNDGRMDLLLTTVNGPARLLRNVAPRPGHWLTIRAVDPKLGGRDMYGAQIIVTAAGRRSVGWVNPASGILSSNDPRVHFGLGAANHVEQIEVNWPDGLHETFPGGAADRLIVLRKG